MTSGPGEQLSFFIGLLSNAVKLGGLNRHKYAVYRAKPAGLICDCQCFYVAADAVCLLLYLNSINFVLFLVAADNYLI